MKRVLMLGITVLLFINCNQNGIDDSIVKPGVKDIVVAVDDSFEGTEDMSLVLPDFLLNDTFKSGSITVGIPTQSVNEGTIVKDGTNYTYTSKAGFTGTDSFEYTICSTITPESCSTATVTLIIKPTTVNSSGNVGSFNIPTELTAYYNDVDFTVTGTSLKDELGTTIISSQTTNLSYTPGVWDAVKKSDLDPTDNTKVVLIYGYDDADGNYVTDKTRSKDLNGGSAGTEWNREHVYPRSLGNPNLGSTGPGSDAHHLRPCDITFNSQRGNKKFATGSGNAGDTTGGWYPGDEWKGDVARMMMYMYVRYGTQCLPKNVIIGSVNSSDSNMIDLLLEWNIEDPVSDFEKNRNNVIADVQGNRNPFIDNPYLATVTWGGSDAENTWK